MADGPAAGRWRRLGARFGAFETSLETSLRPWIALTAIVFVGWLALVVLSMPEWGGEPFHDRAFDAATWRAADGGARDCPRGEMVADLAARELQIGRSRAELVALLGAPDAGLGPRWCGWRIGWWSGLRLDQDVLELHFDPDGALAHWARAQR